MILFDSTKALAAKHRSGLMRVSERLRQELGDHATVVHWPLRAQPRSAGTWFLTSELFSEAERPGMTSFLADRPYSCAAIFHDAIPLKLPHITWPQSVARHPGYMKLLSQFDQVWAVSQASKEDLEGFWRWQGVSRSPTVGVLPLGADFHGGPRVTARDVPAGGVPTLVCVGIVEPRKNQSFLLDACEQLWADGMRFDLHIVGRVNPHFGGPVLDRIKAARRRFPGRLRFHQAIDDASLVHLYATARAMVFPTIAEGCGLPLLESLWQGVPCVCSDLPVLRENADGGGCLPVRTNDFQAWADALRRIVADQVLAARLTSEATTRVLPTWAGTAAAIRARLAR